MESSILVCAAVLVSAILRGLTGFGFALAAVPLIALTSAPLHAITVTVLLQVLIGIVDLRQLRREYDRAEVLRLGLGAVIGLPFGIAGLLLLDVATARIVIGALALAGLIVALREPRNRIRPTTSLTASVGAVSGLFAGLAAMPGPPAVAYFLATRTPPVTTRASLMMFFFITSILTLPGLIWGGAVTREAMVTAILCWPVLILGTWIGRAAFRRLGDGNYRLIAVGVMALASVLTGWRGLTDLLG